jgi:hypothetical protein
VATDQRWMGIQHSASLDAAVMENQMTTDAAGPREQAIRLERLDRLYNIIANLAHVNGDHTGNALEDEAHDIIRALRLDALRPEEPPPQDTNRIKQDWFYTEKHAQRLELEVASLRAQLTEAQQELKHLGEQLLRRKRTLVKKQ